jgi:ABC-type histidine transport system ATPase subunit
VIRPGRHHDRRPARRPGASFDPRRSNAGIDGVQRFNLFSHRTALENVTEGPIHVMDEKPVAA